MTRTLLGLVAEELRDALFVTAIVLIVGVELGVLAEVGAVALFNFIIHTTTTHTNRRSVTMRKFIPAIAVLAVLAAPAAASASTFASDQHVTVKEARAEVRDLLGDPDIRASEFRAGAHLEDGTATTVEDPAVASTRYRLNSCHSVSKASVECSTGVAAWTTSKPTGNPYRYVMQTVLVHAIDRRTGITTVTDQMFGGATPPDVN